MHVLLTGSTIAAGTIDPFSSRRFAAAGNLRTLDEVVEAEERRMFFRRRGGGQTTSNVGIEYTKWAFLSPENWQWRHRIAKMGLSVTHGRPDRGAEVEIGRLIFQSSLFFRTEREPIFESDSCLPQFSRTGGDIGAVAVLQKQVAFCLLHLPERTTSTRFCPSGAMRFVPTLSFGCRAFVIRVVRSSPHVAWVSRFL